MPHTGTVAPDHSQVAKDVAAFLRSFPAVAEALPHVKQMIAAEFSEPEVQLHLLAPNPAEDPDPLLCVLVQHSEEPAHARRIRRALLNGRWLDLPAEVLGRVALQLKARAE